MSANGSTTDIHPSNVWFKTLDGLYSCQFVPFWTPGVMFIKRPCMTSACAEMFPDANTDPKGIQVRTYELKGRKADGLPVYEEVG